MKNCKANVHHWTLNYRFLNNKPELLRLTKSRFRLTTTNCSKSKTTHLKQLRNSKLTLQCFTSSSMLRLRWKRSSNSKMCRMRRKSSSSNFSVTNKRKELGELKMPNFKKMMSLRSLSRCKRSSKLWWTILLVSSRRRSLSMSSNCRKKTTFCKPTWKRWRSWSKRSNN